VTSAYVDGSLSAGQQGVGARLCGELAGAGGLGLEAVDAVAASSRSYIDDGTQIRRVWAPALVGGHQTICSKPYANPLRSDRNREVPRLTIRALRRHQAPANGNSRPKPPFCVAPRRCGDLRTLLTCGFEQIVW
jgi:hypothetical protein